MCGKGTLCVQTSKTRYLFIYFVLSSRVREPNKDGWRKLKRLIDYLKVMAHMHLVLCMDEEILILKWHIDASFAVYDNF